MSALKGQMRMRLLKKAFPSIVEQYCNAAVMTCQHVEEKGKVVKHVLCMHHCIPIKQFVPMYYVYHLGMPKYLATIKLLCRLWNRRRAGNKRRVWKIWQKK